MLIVQDFSSTSAAWFAKLELLPDGWYLRTSQTCWLSPTGFAPYSESLPNSGVLIVSSGELFQQPMLARPTFVSVSGLWPIPTPTSSDAKGSRRHGHMIKGNAGTTLLDYARTFQTPDASPHKYRLKGKTQQSTSLMALAKGKLNPNWVEWLMGYPDGWTDLSRPSGLTETSISTD